MGQTLNNALLGSAETENHQTEPWKQVLTIERFCQQILPQLTVQTAVGKASNSLQAICHFQYFPEILPLALLSVGISPAQFKISQ